MAMCGRGRQSASRRKCTGMSAPARGRQRPRVSPREHVHQFNALPLEIGKVLQLAG